MFCHVTSFESVVFENVAAMTSSLRPSCFVILFFLFLVGHCLIFHPFSCVHRLVSLPVWSQVAIMAQDGFALLKQVAAAHLGNAAVQVQLCGAMCILARNAENQVRRPVGGHVVVTIFFVSEAAAYEG